MSVIETQTFRLVDRSDIDGFLEADRRVQTELMLQKPTFLRRTTARSSDGEWIVLVLWASEGDANTSDQRFEGNPANAAFMAYVDLSTLSTRRYQTLD
jgi:hypothetical protein